MKKLFTTLALCAAMALQACWIDNSAVYIEIRKVNNVLLLEEDQVLTASAVSLPCSVRISQNGFSSSYDNPTIVKLQYAVYRKVGNNYVKVVPVTTVVTLGDGSAALPLTGNSTVNYFGTVKIRPDKNIIKANDYIVIRVWASNGLLSNAGEHDDINMELLMNWHTEQGQVPDYTDLDNGWAPRYAVCVQFNGKWGAR